MEVEMVSSMWVEGKRGYALVKLLRRAVMEKRWARYRARSESPSSVTRAGVPARVTRW